MENKEINITYETLFELLRREKNREELQKLDINFFVDVADYLKAKIELLKKPKDDIFAADERRKAELQLVNIQKILRELYERRERKIIDMALDNSKISSGIDISEVVDTSNLLKEEKELFDNSLNLFNRFRKGILLNILDAKLPEIEKKREVEADMDEPKEFVEDKDSLDKDKEKDVKLVRFLCAVPKFLGKDLEEYGPFEKEDTASLPKELADVLIKKERAEEMKKE